MNANGYLDKPRRQVSLKKLVVLCSGLLVVSACAGTLREYQKHADLAVAAIKAYDVETALYHADFVPDDIKYRLRYMAYLQVRDYENCYREINKTIEELSKLDLGDYGEEVKLLKQDRDLIKIKLNQQRISRQKDTTIPLNSEPDAVD